MTILHPRLFLAICAGAGLIAFTPEWRRPPAELAAIDESAVGSTAPRVDGPPSQAADHGPEARLALAARLTEADERIDDAGPGAGAPLAAIRPPPPPEAALSDADLAAEFADAGVPFSSPRRRRARSASARLAALVQNPPPSPHRPARNPPPSGAARPARICSRRRPKRRARHQRPLQVAPSPPAAAPGADPPLPPPPPPLGSEAAILYNKGDAAGLVALAEAANDAAGRSALEWTALRANAHPSFASLAAFLEAHPTWPSRGWIRELEEAELAAHPEAPAPVAAFFAGGAPQTSAGKIAAARAAKAMGRPRRGVANHPRLVARRQSRRADREHHPAGFRLFASQRRTTLIGRPPPLRRLRSTPTCPRCGAWRSRRSGAGRGPHRRRRARRRAWRLPEGRSPQRSATILACCSPGSSTPCCAGRLFEAAVLLEPRPA